MNEKDSPFNEKSKVTIQTTHQAESMLDVTTLPKNSTIDPIDTSVIDDQWAEMTQDWQSQPFTKTDINKLLKQTKQRTLWAKCLLALDIISTLAILFVAVYMWINGSKDQSTIIYLGGGGLLSIVFVYYAIKVRLSAWKINCGSPDKAIEQAIAGCHSSLNYIKLIKLSYIIVWPFAHWYIIAVAQQTEKSPIIGLVFINVLLGTAWFVSHRFYKKRVEELKQLEATFSK
jgi:hypothetical protein